MFRTKTNIEAPSTSFKDASKKRKKTIEKKNRTKQLASVSFCENEAQIYQDNGGNDTKDVTTNEGGPVEKTDSLSTPKRETDSCVFIDMETPETRTQTRLTLKYDDLLLSQTIDPNCEVSWECISPEVVQKIHRDIQRKPNLDISKILALLTDEDETPPSNSSSYINSLLNAKPNVPCSKVVLPKRKLKSIRKNTTASKMEEMIRKLEMRIKSEAEEQVTDDSMNNKRITDPLETIQPAQNTSSENQKCAYSNRNLTKCLQGVCEPTSSDTKNTTPLNRSFNSCMVNNEDTSWSDDDLFCDESFIAKVTQTSENKTRPQIDAQCKFSPVNIFSEQLTIANMKTIPTSCKKSPSLGPKYTGINKQRETKTESSREFPKTSKSATIVKVGKTVMNPVQQSNNNSDTNRLLQDDLDLGFSDSDTDELLSQLTEQEICCALKTSDKKGTEKVPIENIPIFPSDSLPVVTVDCKTDKKVSVIEKTAVDSYLDFLDISSNSCRKPSPGKQSLKKKAYSFKSVKNNQKPANSTSSTCSVPSKQNDIDPTQENSFDDPFSDKDEDEDMLKFAESLDQTERGKVSEVKKASKQIDPKASKQIDPKAKNVCTKEEIERKKREALIRRKKLGAITKCNMK